MAPATSTCARTRAACIITGSSLFTRAAKAKAVLGVACMQWAGQAPSPACAHHCACRGSLSLPQSASPIARRQVRLWVAAADHKQVVLLKVRSGRAVRTLAADLREQVASAAGCAKRRHRRGVGEGQRCAWWAAQCHPRTQSVKGVGDFSVPERASASVCSSADAPMGSHKEKKSKDKSRKHKKEKKHSSDKRRRRDSSDSESSASSDDDRKRHKSEKLVRDGRP